MVRSLGLLVLLCVGFVADRTAGQCLVGYVDPADDTISRNCFRFATTELTWLDAREKCRLDGGDLAIITTTKELNFLTPYLKNAADLNATIYYSVGLYKPNIAFWEWIDGTPTDPRVVKFANSVASSTRAALRSDGNFMQLQAQDKHYYICERSKYLPVKCDTTQGWSESKVDGTCIKRISSYNNFANSRALCKQNEADLLVINNDKANAFYASQLPLSGETWLGLTTSLNNETDENGYAKWKWVDGNELNYTKWSNNYQENVTQANRQNGCAVLARANTWSGKLCSYMRIPNIYCQRPQGDCKIGWTRKGSSCFSFGYRKTWLEADTDCKTQGANLVVYNNNDTKEFVESSLSTFSTAGLSYIWIGYSQSGPYEPFEPSMSLSAMTNWQDGFPRNGTIPFGCGRIRTASTGEWSSSSCADLNGYICQAPAGKTLTPAQPYVPKQRLYCEVGWTQWEDKCFIALRDSAKFDDAERICEVDYVATLATVDKIEYQALLTRLTATSNVRSYWIGLKKEGRGIYKWSETGSEANSFQNFADNANLNSLYNCVMMYGGSRGDAGRWNFQNCASALPIICSKDPTLVSPVQTPPPTNGVTPSARCPPGWVEDGVTDYCYNYRPEEQTWSSALQSCKAMDGTLASILSIQQMRAVASSIKDKQAAWWIGLNKRGSESGRYRWANSQDPIPFTYWDADEPNHKTGDCVASMSSTGAWQFKKCEERFSYICQRVAYNLRPTIAPPVITTPVGGSLGCNSRWSQISRAGNCYRVFSGALSWADASQRCKNATANGNLVSIGDAYEANFVRQLLFSASFGTSINDTWIGMYDKLDAAFPRMVEYVWSDNSKVAYTAWSVETPSSSAQDCVALSWRTNRWYDTDCASQTMSGFVCEAPPVVFAAPQTTTPAYGCPQPFNLAFEGKCYYVNDQDLQTWDQAKLRCEGIYGRLAILATPQESSFIALTLATGDVFLSPYWIGLSGTNDNWKWLDGTTPAFVNWVNYTEAETTTCVSISDESTTTPGMWLQKPCDTLLPYICEKQRDSWTRSTPKPTSVPSFACPTGWLSYPLSSRCYLPVNIPSSVSEAVEYCKTQYSGLLATFTSYTEQNYIAERMDSQFRMTEAWIGLSKRNAERGWQWMDGTPILYEKWDFNEPDNTDDTKTCAFMVERASTSESIWISDDCSDNLRKFICMRSRGSAQLTTTPRPIDVNASALCGGPGWLVHKSSCYWFETSYQATWWSALDQCHNLNSSLVSVLDQAENDFVRSSVGNSLLRYLWIGLNQWTENNNEWADGSPIGFVNKDSSTDDDSACYSISASSGRWFKQHCELQNSFVCKRPIDGIVVRPTAPPANTGNCPEGYIFYIKGSKCFKIVTDAVASQSEARAQCKAGSANNGELASFSDMIEFNFVLSQLRNVSAKTQSAYIGLYDYSTARGQPQFRWLDNTPLYFTKWDYNEPSIIKTTPPGSCVDMYVSGQSAGNWRAQKACSTNQTFICSAPKGAYPNTRALTKEAAACEIKWVPYMEHCYYVGGTSNDEPALGWDDARDACMNFDSDLVSIHDPYEQAAITFAVMSIDNFVTPLNYWIGLTTYNAPNVWEWSDTWPVDYTGWQATEPNDATAKRCAAGNIRSQWASNAGYWTSMDCRTKNAYVCRKTKAVKDKDQSHEAFEQGTCPSGWVNGISKCYFIDTRARYSWSELTIQCKTVGGMFSPLETLADNQLVAMEIGRQKNLYGTAATDVWIGLSTHGGIVSAPDGSVLSYSNWADGERVGSNQQGVYMKQTSFWYLTDPRTKLGYVCKKSKSPLPTTQQIQAGTSESDFAVTKGPAVYVFDHTYDSGTGAIIGVCIGFVVLLLAIVGVLIFLKRKNMVPSKVDEVMSKTATLRSGASAATSFSPSQGASTSTGLVGFENAVFDASKDSASVKASNEKSDDFATV